MVMSEVFPTWDRIRLTNRYRPDRTGRNELLVRFRVDSSVEYIYLSSDEWPPWFLTTVIPSRTTHRAETKPDVTRMYVSSKPFFVFLSLTPALVPYLGLHSAAANGSVGLVKYALSYGQSRWCSAFTRTIAW